MIAISTPTFSLDGDMVFADRFLESKGDVSSIERRVSRRKTLDGSAVLNDSGFSDSDRTFSVLIDQGDRAALEFLARLVKLYPLITICTEDGAFAGAPEQFLRRYGDYMFKVLIQKKLSE